MDLVMHLLEAATKKGQKYHHQLFNSNIIPIVSFYLHILSKI